MSHQPIESDSLLISSSNPRGVFVYALGRCQRVYDFGVSGLALLPAGLAWAEFNDKRSLTVFNGDTALRTWISDSSLDLHDLLYIEAHYYAVSTETNEVIKIDENMRTVKRWRLEGEVDSSHINSVQIFQGRLIASAFGFFKTHREYKGRTEENGIVFDVETQEVLIGGLTQPHSLTVEGDNLFLCNSDKSEVREYKGFDLVRTYTLSGYVRGLVVTEDRLYVGESCSRNKANFKFEDEDLPHAVDTARVWVVDRKSGETITTFPVDTLEIYDIRLVQPKILAGILPTVASYNRASIEADYKQSISNLTEQVTHLSEHVESLKHHLDLHQKDNQELRAQLEGLTQYAESLATANSELDGRLDAVQRSTSYRLGNKLVRMGRVFKKSPG